jgi:hypothetical protein
VSEDSKNIDKIISKLDSMIESNTRMVVFIEQLLGFQTTLLKKQHIAEDSFKVIQKIDGFITSKDGLDKTLRRLQDERKEQTALLETLIEKLDFEDISAIKLESQRINAKLATIEGDIAKARGWLIKIIFVLQPILTGFVAYLIKQLSVG